MTTHCDDLSAHVIERLITAAQHGWAPADLEHVLGPHAYPIIYRASPHVPARITSPALRKAWLQMAPPDENFIPRDKLRAVMKELIHLPRLRDTELLASGESLREDGLSDKQRKIRAKVLGLLRKAESTSFEDEAEVLISKAQSLQQKYRIEDLLSSELPNLISHRVHIHPPYIKHQASLLSTISDANGCTTLLIHDKGLACVIGAPADAAHCADLFASLNRQCDWFMRNGDGAEIARATNSTAAYRRSFRLSYAARIGELLTQANEDGIAENLRESQYCSHHAEAVATQTLPALQARTDHAIDTRNRLFPNLTEMSLSMNSLHGINDGIAAADKSHLGGDASGLGSVPEITR